MRTEPSLIMIEFNELCPPLIEQFMQSGRLPHFSRFYREAEIWVTDAEAQGEDLNPWVQWVSVHSGLGADEHNIKTLSQGHELPYKAVWDLLSDAGYRVWVCGSMNSRYDAPLNGYLVPDPWSTGIEPYPRGEFSGFIEFMRKAVQEHTSSGAAGASTKQFLKYMARHGLAPSTVVRAGLQVLSERLAPTAWKRAAIMDLMSWDVFRHYYRRFRPQFATFFSNSTAHFQHCYWRNMEPGKFKSPPPTREGRGLQSAIQFGYEQMDAMIGRFLRLAGQGTTLVFCTGLSQQPYLDFEEAGGRHYYRALGHKALATMLGIEETFTYEPVMADQFYLRFDDAATARSVHDRLTRLHVRDRRVFPDERTRLLHMSLHDAAILAQCRCTSVVPADAAVTSDDSARAFRFLDLFYPLETVKSGRHHPDGMLWIRRPERRHRVASERVSIRAIAPTILQEFGVTIPSFMRAEPLGSGVAERRADMAMAPAN